MISTVEELKIEARYGRGYWFNRALQAYLIICLVFVLVALSRAFALLPLFGSLLGIHAPDLLQSDKSVRSDIVGDLYVDFDVRREALVSWPITLAFAISFFAFFFLLVHLRNKEATLRAVVREDIAGPKSDASALCKAFQDFGYFERVQIGGENTASARNHSLIISADTRDKFYRGRLLADDLTFIMMHEYCHCVTRDNFYYSVFRAIFWFMIFVPIFALLPFTAYAIMFQIKSLFAIINIPVVNGLVLLIATIGNSALIGSLASAFFVGLTAQREFFCDHIARRAIASNPNVYPKADGRSLSFKSLLSTNVTAEERGQNMGGLFTRVDVLVVGIVAVWMIVRCTYLFFYPPGFAFWVSVLDAAAVAMVVLTIITFWSHFSCHRISGKLLFWLASIALWKILFLTSILNTIDFYHPVGNELNPFSSAFLRPLVFVCGAAGVLAVLKGVRLLRS